MEKQNSDLNAIKQIIECSELYLIDYFDSIKTKVDVEFVSKLELVTNLKLKEKIIKKWCKLIEIIEETLKICIKNKSKELIEKANEELSKLELNKSQINEYQLDIQRLKLKLESRLLANDSYLVISYKNESLKSNNIFL